MSTIAAVVAVAREKQITVNAASLAFYTFNVLVALVVLFYSASTLFGTGSVLAAVLHALTGVSAAEVQRLFGQVGSNAAGRRRAIVLAVVIALWSSFRLFRAVESIFAEVYGTRKERHVLGRIVDSAFVLLAVTLTFVVMVSIGSIFLFRTAGWTGMVLGPVVLWLALFVLFFPVFYRFTGEDVSVREIVPGTAVAAAGWTASAVGLRVYVTVSESVDLYGIVGGVLLVLTWLYIVGLSVLAGVVVNGLLAGRIEADREWSPFGR